jgi:curved DNA-binding protein CbpA
MEYEEVLRMMQKISAKLRQDFKKMNAAIEVVECLQYKQEYAKKRVLVTRVCQLLRGM